MRTLLLIIILVFSGIVFANSQSISGDGNNAVMGDNNQISNNQTISKIRSGFDYTSTKAKEDLKKGNYKNVYFEDKKEEDSLPLSKKKIMLILTATNFESKTLHQEAAKFGLNVSKEIVNDFIIYHFGELGGVDIYHMQPSMMGMLEPGSTPLALLSVFHHIKPAYIIATGIAFGRESKGQKLGDILVSSQVVNYETRKEINGDIYFRGDKATSPLLSRVNSAIHNWDGAKVHTGLVLSGNVLVNSQEFLKHLAKKEPEYAGGDMESYGVYSVASMMSTKWIMIKGISDWGDGTKNDNFHKIALENVGRFIFHIVKQGNLK